MVFKAQGLSRLEKAWWEPNSVVFGIHFVIGVLFVMVHFIVGPLGNIYSILPPPPFHTIDFAKQSA